MKLICCAVLVLAVVLMIGMTFVIKESYFKIIQGIEKERNKTVK